MLVDGDSIHYVPVLVLVVIGAVIALALIGANTIFGQKVKPNPQKTDVYECGVPATGSAHQQFSVRYYLIGIIFLLFDVEVVFLYPWAAVFKDFAPYGATIFWSMVAFILILDVAYFYLLRKKAFSWD